MAPLAWLQWQFDMTGGPPPETPNPSLMSTHITQANRINTITAVGIVVGIVGFAALIFVAFVLL